MESSEATPLQNFREKPIPIVLPTVDGWEEIPIDLEGEKNKEPLVPVGLFSPGYNAIATRAIYAGETYTSSLPHHNANKFEGALLAQFVRRGVADRLLNAQDILRKQQRGLYLVVYDGYRPVEVQQALWDATRAHFVIMNEVEGFEWDDERIDEETRNYASPPSTDPEKPSPHLTGGAVDIGIFQIEDSEVDRQIQDLQGRINTLESDSLERVELELAKHSLIKQHANELDFGTPFDYFDKKSASNHYEKLLEEKGQAGLSTEEQVALRNRRLLRWTMAEAGFSPDDEEWWHFDCGDQMMAARGDGAAVYGRVIDLTDENKAIESKKRELVGSS